MKKKFKVSFELKGEEVVWGLPLNLDAIQNGMDEFSSGLACEFKNLKIKEVPIKKGKK
jgi:hypothetical protein